MTYVENFNDYLEPLDKDIRERLVEIFNLCDELMPLAKKTYSYSMPCYTLKRNIIYFGVSKKHIGVYPKSEVIEHFSDKLVENNIPYSKGTIKLVNNKEIDFNLLKEIINYRYQEELEFSKT